MQTNRLLLPLYNRASAPGALRPNAKSDRAILHADAEVLVPPSMPAGASNADFRQGKKLLRFERAATSKLLIKRSRKRLGHSIVTNECVGAVSATRWKNLYIYRLYRCIAVSICLRLTI